MVWDIKLTWSNRIKISQLFTGSGFTSPEILSMSLRLQLDYDAARANDELAEVLANIKPMEVAWFKVIRLDLMILLFAIC